MTDMAALADALGCGLEAANAIQADDRDAARRWLAQGLGPSAKAFPPGSRESFGLALVYGALLEEAAA